MQGFPAIPSPKEFRLDSGRTVSVPRNEAPEVDLSAEPAAPHPGAPLDPTGDPLVAAIGPGSYANRPDIPEATLDGAPRIIPMRADQSLHVDAEDTDPRGMELVAADGETVGSVSDLWIDLAEPQIYFLEVQTGGDEGGRTVMVPFGFAEIDKKANKVKSQCALLPSVRQCSRAQLAGSDNAAGRRQDHGLLRWRPDVCR